MSGLRAAETDAVGPLVGEWDLKGTDTTLEIRPDHSVFHSRLGLGEIEHENVHYFKVEYRHTHLLCHYQIKKYSNDELSIVVSIRPADSDCDLGEMRRSPGSARPLAQGADGRGHGTQAGPDAKAPEQSSSGVRALTQSQEARLEPGNVFKECDGCPDMVVVPPGRYLMGSPAGERGRNENEGPLQQIDIPSLLAVGRYAITRDQFMKFVAATNYSYGRSCHAEAGNKWVVKDGASFLNPPGFSQKGRDPAVCISWKDACAYAKWLAAITGKTYRLLSEAEREYVTRAGTTTPYWWGDEASPAQANFDTRAEARSADRNRSIRLSSLKRRPAGDGDVAGRAGAAKGPSPRGAPRSVDSYLPNPWGLFNVHGNVAEWVEDCWNANHMGAPADGAPALTGDCSRRVVKGGGWSYWPEDLRSAYREAAGLDERYFQIGFRVARKIAPGNGELKVDAN
jgi:formylglycine-generating enzyme required for sulfatase activity